MADRQKWSISEVKTVEGETMIVGGESYEFGLIAAVTNEADARQIIADRESHDALVKALETLLSEAESFSVSGVYFSEECMGHKGPALARAALALCEQHEKTGGEG